MKTFLIIFSLLFSTVSSSALETKLDLTFWYDNTPPTEKDESFFNGAKKAIQVLQNNNSELEAIAKEKGISIVDNEFSKKVVDDLLKKHDINKDFFYNLEKAQLIMVVKMLINKGRTGKEYTESDALDYSDQFITFAEKETSKNRDISKSISFNLDDALLATMVGGYVVTMINGLTGTSATGNTHSGDLLQNSLFGEK